MLAGLGCFQKNPLPLYPQKPLLTSSHHFPTFVATIISIC